ncbi:MAG: protein-disulfide reductase DsbD [Bdellovibrio sp.]|nr:protein-disulfide reductase DsbD [Methylotenera sp.]
MKRILGSIVLLLVATFCTPLFYAAESSGAVKNLFTEDSPSAQKDEEFLSPDKAFKLVITQDKYTLVANFTVEPGYYLYKNRIKFTLQPNEDYEVSLPNGQIKEDKNFGKMEVYHHDFKGVIYLKRIIKPTITVKAVYQGCSEKGLCYAPQTKTIDIALNDVADTDSSISAASSGIANDDDKTTSALKTGNLWLVIAGFFVAGLLLSFTPCVLPMIPILSSIIVGSQSKQKVPTRLHAFGLSVAYVLGMALSYTLAGVAAGLSGNLLSQSLQSPLILGLTALLFVILAFSMFGFYELKMPSALESKLLNTSNNLKGGEFLGVFIMGVLSALIVSPCVAAPLAGALIYIGQTHNVLLGGAGLFALAIGMGVPLLLIGASAGSLLPKAGSWMTVVRNLFGVLMLAIAAYIAWPVLPASLTAPVNNLLGFSAKHTLPFTPVKSVAELNAVIASANGKTVMLDFYADWCTSCKEMEKLTFSDEKVKAALANTVLLQADVTENNDNDQALLKRFGLFGPPGIIFFDKNGVEIKTRVIGYKNADDFAAILKKVQQ